MDTGRSSRFDLWSVFATLAEAIPHKDVDGPLRNLLTDRVSGLRASHPTDQSLEITISVRGGIRRVRRTRRRRRACRSTLYASVLEYLFAAHRGFGRNKSPRRPVVRLLLDESVSELAL